MPHDGVNFWYFKLKLFDVTEFIVWKIGKSEFIAKTQFILNSTIIIWYNKPFFVFFPLKELKIGARVSTGILGYGLRTEMIRKFFPFQLRKRFRKSGTIFFCKPEISRTLFWNYWMLRKCSRKFWFTEQLFQKKVLENVEDILNLCKR